MEYAPRSKATAEYRSLINEVTGVPMKKSQKKDSKRPVRRPSKKQ
jgi:chromosome partitioning protein